MSYNRPYIVITDDLNAEEASFILEVFGERWPKENVRQEAYTNDSNEQRHRVVITVTYFDQLPAACGTVDMILYVFRKLKYDR
jgi:hypothetical protein